MDDVDSHPIPHVAIRTLVEVGVVVGIFGLGMLCLACSMSGPRSSVWCWKKLLMRRQNNDDDDESSSYIEDAGSGRPAPHVFESLNELVFFEASDRNGFLAASGNSREDSGEDNRLLIPTTMDKIFPDLLGKIEEGAANKGGAPDTSGERSSELREPLL